MLLSRKPEDRLEHYRQSIKALLTRYAESMSQHPEPNVELKLVFDTENDRYLLLDVGWCVKKRAHH
ncbi:MAG: XisI protein [Leptolyngbya sp. UWPOB_LEPTO1]|uniref:element excision factor XisI family protein n=1 Tax=Leptolyngbya sp. UWPOB_LEPTO1 TaxID=2815653 RepID=UPI001ACEE122|nr:element excision factor XisI family protein [Leptolyngbya sp. UWPOB_LEPTO1]MBN8560680.1 XisI protein [Leptolyngbya sp. UWPOB_LEPTO1]